MMNAQLLSKLFGSDGRWSGACIVVLDADANVFPIGNDAIVQGGVKAFAPRLITGRVPADAVRFVPEWSSLLLIQKTVIRQQTGEDLIKRAFVIVDANHVAAVEFAEMSALDRLGIEPPA